MSTSPEVQVWNLPKGALIHINGLPYFLAEPAKVEGFHDPAKAEPQVRTGNIQSEHAPTASSARA